MNTITEKLLIEIKSKPPTEWGIHELEDFGWKVRFVYQYGDILDKDVLRPVYDRIVKMVNGSKSYVRMNPAALDNIDKLKN